MLLFEKPRPGRRVVTQNNATQTEDEKPSSSRVATLSTKFVNGPRAGGYYNRPTDLPIRTSSLNRLSTSPKLSPILHPSVRTPSPLANLNNSLTNLTIEAGDTDSENESSYDEDYPGGMEKESYSLMVEQKPPSVELSDKPPRYPFSPTTKYKNALIADPRCRPRGTSSGRQESSSEDVSESSRNIPYFLDNESERKGSESDSAGGHKLLPLRKMDSEDEPWWQHSHSEPSERSENGYVIRKMDSAEVLWLRESDSAKSDHRGSDVPSDGKSESEGVRRWLNTNNSHDESGETTNTNHSGQGYVLRKMDSFDIPWWCRSEEQRSSRSEDKERNSSCAPTDDENKSFFKLRKMDSSEVLWGANSEASNGSQSINEDGSHLSRTNDDLSMRTSQQSRTNDDVSTRTDDDFSMYKIRKFDSGERECWAEDERSKTNTPDWWNSSREDESEYVESYRSNKGLRITKIESSEGETRAEEPSRNGYRIMKIESGERPWWLGQESSKGEESGPSELGGSSDDKMRANAEKIRLIDEFENIMLYIGKYTNVDDLLGTEAPPLAAPVTPTSDTSSECETGMFLG